MPIQRSNAVGSDREGLVRGTRHVERLGAGSQVSGRASLSLQSCRFASAGLRGGSRPATQTLLETRSVDRQRLLSVPDAGPGSAQVVGSSSSALTSGDVLTSFDPVRSGLRFRNFFPNAKVFGFPADGLCGGMAFTMLDYHHAGRPAPRRNTVPPTEKDPLGSYIQDRQIQSLMNVPLAKVVNALLFGDLPFLAGAVLSNYNLRTYLILHNASDETLRDRSFNDEYPRIREQLDADRPVIVGLIAKGGLTDDHQVIAYGYREDSAGTILHVLNPNYPGRPYELQIFPNQDLQDPHKTWRGMFLEEYSPEQPPLLGIAEETATAALAFDALFYGRTQPDVGREFGADEELLRRHWVPYGLLEGRRGSLVLSPRFYLKRHPDLAATFFAPGFPQDDFESALAHFVTQGLPAEGRRGCREFDVRLYLDLYADLRATYGADYKAAAEHFVLQGLPAEGRRGSREFDVRFYLDLYLDLKRAYGSEYQAATEHFIAQGLQVEGRRGSREFDVQFYLGRYADLQAEFVGFGTNYLGAMEHFITQGLFIEGRQGSREFDVRFYLSSYSDLQQRFGTDYEAATNHFLTRGLPIEGRRGSREFDVQFYLGTYADVRALVGSNYVAAMDHWISRGFGEGRKGAP